MFNKLKTAIVLMGYGLLGCGTGIVDLDQPNSLNKNLPPWSQGTPKADQIDPRDNQPALYGYSDPPSGLLGLPGEFEPVQELFVSWTGVDDFVAPEFVQLVKNATTQATVTILVSNQREEADLNSFLKKKKVKLDRIKTMQAPYNSFWIRDYGPQVVRTSTGPAVIDLRYLFDRNEDDAFPTRFAEIMGWPVSRPKIELEGGNLQSDGTGRCTTSDKTIARNQALFGMTEQDVRDVLAQYFGCTEVTILPVLTGWEQTGHVDMYTKMTAPGEILVGQIFEPGNPSDQDNASRMDQAAELLLQNGFKVRRIPMPKATGTGFRSYTNSTEVNQAVLVAVYAKDTQYQEQALAVFSEAYPGRTIIPVESSQYLAFGGAIHCVTITVGQ